MSIEISQLASKGHDVRTLLKAAHIAARECDADFMDLGGRDGTSSVVFFITLSDVTHPDFETVG